MDFKKVLSALQGAAREEILRRFRSDSCIASTRIIIDVLGRYGFRAENPFRCIITAMRATKFVIDFIPSKAFEGFTDDRLWNGWACPYFSFDEAQKIAEAQKELGLNAYYDADSDGFAFEVENTGGEYDIFPSEVIDGRKLYPVGAGCWIWEEEASEGVTA